MQKQGINYGEQNQNETSSEKANEVPCIAKIQQITGNGTLIIEFSHDMNSSKYNISLINNDILGIVVLPSENKLELESFKESDHALTWKVTSFK